MCGRKARKADRPSAKIEIGYRPAKPGVAGVIMISLVPILLDVDGGQLKRHVDDLEHAALREPPARAPGHGQHDIGLLGDHRADDKTFRHHPDRSEEHTSELQSLMRISYSV